MNRNNQVQTNNQAMFTLDAFCGTSRSAERHLASFSPQFCRNV